MKVLMLGQFFDPEPTLKGLAFALALQRQGCEVEVLTGFPNYPGGKVFPGYRIQLWQREIIEGVRVTRVALYPSHDRSALRRVVNYVSFALSAALLGPFLVRRPDVMFVYHPPVTIALPATVLRAWSGASFAYEIQDLWPDTLRATGMVDAGQLFRLLDYVCRVVYRHADHLVVISDGFRRRLVERGVPAANISVIRNWCDERRMVKASRDPALARRLGMEEGFTVMFAGTMGLAQGLTTLLAAAERCVHELPDVRFVLVGGGVERDALIREAKDRGLHNMHFVPPQPMDEMGGLLALADVLLVHLRADPLFEITIPSKTQAYMFAGVPILMAVRGDAANLILESGGGVVAEPDSPEALVEAIRGLRALSPGERAAMGERGRAFYMQFLSLDAGAARYAEIFRRMLAA